MSWQYFKREEFACPHCGDNRMEDCFIDSLDHLRAEYGLPLVVNSGYRCPVHNQEVSTTGPNGPHTTGRAVDFKIDRGNAFTLLVLAVRSGKFNGIGVNQYGASRFLHLDALDPVTHPRPNLWSYP